MKSYTAGVCQKNKNCEELLMITQKLFPATINVHRAASRVGPDWEITPKPPIVQTRAMNAITSHDRGRQCERDDGLSTLVTLIVVGDTPYNNNKGMMSQQNPT